MLLKMLLKKQKIPISFRFVTNLFFRITCAKFCKNWLSFVEDITKTILVSFYGTQYRPRQKLKRDPTRRYTRIGYQWHLPVRLSCCHIHQLSLQILNFLVLSIFIMPPPMEIGGIIN